MGIKGLCIFLFWSVPVAAFAQGQVIHVSRDWQVVDYGDSCVASTTRQVNGQNYHFEVFANKLKVANAEASVREGEGAGRARYFRFATEAQPRNIFAFAEIQPGLFWNVPRDTEGLLAYIRREVRLRVTGAMVQLDGTLKMTPIDFSLRGSHAALTALAEKCLGNRSLVNAAFEKSFLPNQVNTIDPARYLPEQVVALRSAIRLAQDSYNAQKDAEKNLALLNSRYTQTLQRLAEVEGNLDRWTKRDLATLTERKASLEQAIASQQAEIAAIEGNISRLEQELITANSQYDLAYRELAPLLPEWNRLNDAVASANAAVTQAEERLASAQATVTSRQREINERTNERERNQVRLNDLVSELADARAEVSDAQFELSRFQDDVRRRQLFEQDWEFRNLQSRQRELLSRERTAESELSRAQDRLRNARFDLDRCRSGRPRSAGTEGSSQIAAVQFNGLGVIAQDEVIIPPSRGGVGQPPPPYNGSPGVQPGNPGRPPGVQPGNPGRPPGRPPGNPGRPPGGPLPSDPSPGEPPRPEPPRPDCSAAERALVQAEREYNQATRALNNIRNELNQVRWQLDNARNRIDEQVANERRALERRYRLALQHRDQVEADIAALESRNSNLTNVEIPRLRDQLNSAVATRNSLQAQLPGLREQQSLRQSALQSYVEQTGYALKKSRVDQTAAEVVRIKGLIRQSEASRNRLQSELVVKERALGMNQAEITQLMEKIANGQSQSKELREALATYFAQKAELEAYIKDRETEVLGYREQFLRNLPV